MKRAVSWALAAAIAAWAATLVVRYPTPIDEALPFIVVVLTVVAAITHPAVQLSVPLLLVGEIVVADEHLRLLLFGLMIAIAFFWPILWGPRPTSIPLCIFAILLLRWIPLDQVLIGRELLILAFSAATVALLRFTPLAIAIATAAALFTPAVPLRTLILPAGVMIVAALLRVLPLPPVRLPVTSASAVAVLMFFFAWSGAFARALPIMLRGGPPLMTRVPVSLALPAGASADVDIPDNGRGLILSGANIPRLEGGTVLGVIQPGGIVVRVGDIADWGALRREHYYNSRNPLPQRPGGLVRGYGQTAWIDASGRIKVRPGRVTVTADRNLAPGAKLQIDAIELAR